jgi:ADP-heptose:LPS heptosyltransferase
MLYISGMPNSSRSGRFARFFFRLLGPARGRKMLAGRVASRIADLLPFSFPLDPDRFKRILVILPGKRLQVLHQLRNLAELKAYFKNAAFTVLVEELSVSLVNLIDGLTVVDYAYNEKKLFSAAFKQFTREFHDIVDLCFLLTRDEDLPLLYLAGMTAAPIRIGYGGAGGSPFLNIHLNPSPQRNYLSDWNCAMAEILSAKRARQARWAVARETVAEIDFMWKEMHVDPRSRLVGVDAEFAAHRFGKEWAESFVKALIPIAKGGLYLYAKDNDRESVMEWMSQFKLPVVHSLAIPQIAALISRSALIITGNTLLFGLAILLESEVVGLFNGDQVAEYCPFGPHIRAVVFERTPDANTIDHVAVAATELLMVK